MPEAESKEIVELEPAMPSEAASLMSVIAQAARDPSVEIDKMRALLDMKKELEADENRKAYSRSMNLCQAEMGHVSQDAANSQTHSKYSTYMALDKVLRPIYTRHGFSLEFDTGDCPLELHVRVVIKISHNDGHSETKRLDIPADGKGAKGKDVMTLTHAAMSAVSYGRRGLLKMAFNIAEGKSDDDGNDAGETSEKITSKQADALEALAKEVGADMVLLCEFYEIESLSDVTVKYFNKVKSDIEKKRKPKPETGEAK